MKKWIACITLLCFSSASFSQEFSAKKLQKEMVSTTNNLYVWPYEVSNGFYNEFLASLRTTDSIEAQKCMPKSEAWREVLAYADPFVTYYASHPAYVDYPVVNITQTDAEHFCTWLTEKYNEDPKRKYSKVAFRLPTLAEWEQIASRGDSNNMYPWGYKYIRDGKGQFMLNCTVIPIECVREIEDGFYAVDTTCRQQRRNAQVAGSLNDNAFVTAPVESFVPADNGLFNLSGNVAEMVAEGVAKGGSWNSLPYYCQIWTEPEFTDNEKPSPMVGFRFVMEVVGN